MNIQTGALFSVVTALVLITSASQAFSSTNDCLQGPTAQFGRYVGDWKIEDQQFAQDGSGWAAGAGARWVFECIGDGKAVQDYWMPNDGGWGTNLRTYNATTKKWEIVWVASTQQGLMHISAALQEDGSIKMDVLKPEPKPPRRIRFMEPDDGGWNWVMEMLLDGNEDWTAVYKIRATPWED